VFFLLALIKALRLGRLHDVKCTGRTAVKFTPTAGNISVTLTENENAVCCSIADNGIGISEIDQIHLFERFFKVDKSRDRSLGGNGLGLSLVKKIVTMHNGQINLNSALGKGTEFIITLPRIDKK